MDGGWCFREGSRNDAKVYIEWRYHTGLSIVYTEGGMFHRVGGPALVAIRGVRHWYESGKLHRVGDPAIEYADGNRYWYENDKLHRVGGPAIMYASGNCLWYENGERLIR